MDQRNSAAKIFFKSVLRTPQAARVPSAEWNFIFVHAYPSETEITYSRVLGKQSLCTLRLSSISESTVEISPGDLRGMEAAMAMNVSRMSTLVFLLSFLVSISHAQLTFDHTSAPGTMTILANLDNNGLPDVIGVPLNQTLLVQLNGGGHFLAPVTYPMQRNGASGITVNDFNGDGIADVLAASSSDLSYSSASVIQTATPMEC